MTNCRGWPDVSWAGEPVGAGRGEARRGGGPRSDILSAGFDHPSGSPASSSLLYSYLKLSAELYLAQVRVAKDALPTEHLLLCRERAGRPGSLVSRRLTVPFQHHRSSCRCRTNDRRSSNKHCDPSTSTSTCPARALVRWLGGWLVHRDPDQKYCTS